MSYAFSTTHTCQLETVFPRSLPEPDAGAVLKFHRAEDAYLTLHRKPDANTFVNLGAFRPGELAEMFPELREELERDSYFSVNGYAFPLRRGKTKHLRYLNACYADLDAYGLSGSEALGKTVQAIAEGVVPSASIFGLSGRGVWLFWLLRDATEPELPQRAFPEKRLLYSRVQKALHERIKNVWPELEPDGNALDMVRVTRVPGSVNGRNEQRVVHFASLTPAGKLRVYTLEELADFVDVEERKPVPAKILRFGRRLPNNRNGWTARWEKALRYFQALLALRGGGFIEGCRNNGAYIYSLLLRRNGLSEGGVFTTVAAFGRECWPPLTDVEVLGAVVSTQSTQATIHISTARMSSMLKVTETEAAALVPFMPKTRAPRGKRREKRMSLRRARVQEIVAELGEVPPAADISRILKRDGFPGASPRNVVLDLGALGLASPRKRRPRRKREKQPGLPLHLPEVEPDFPVFKLPTIPPSWGELPGLDFTVFPRLDFSVEPWELPPAPPFDFPAAALCG